MVSLVLCLCFSLTLLLLSLALFFLLFLLSPTRALSLPLSRSPCSLRSHFFLSLSLSLSVFSSVSRGQMDWAKEHANIPKNDDELRKRLWLRIAKHLISTEKDIKKAIGVLEQCPKVRRREREREREREITFSQNRVRAVGRIREERLPETRTVSPNTSCDESMYRVCFGLKIFCPSFLRSSPSMPSVNISVTHWRATTARLSRSGETWSST